MKKFFKIGSNKNKGLNGIGSAVSSSSGRRRSSSFSSIGSARNSFHFDSVYSGYPKLDVLSKDKQFTKFHKACYVGDLSKVEKLIKKFDVNECDSELRTPLHFSSANAHKEVIWFLLGSKAKPNLADSDGNTPLLKAVQCGHTEIVHFLLDRGADPNAKNNDGDTGLHLAARNEQIDLAMVLIQKRADVNALNKEWLTPLLVTVYNGHTELCEMLLRHGASVSHYTNNKRTCLILACESGSVDLVRLFLKEGVDIDASDDQGHTARDVAYSLRHDDCVHLIEEATKRRMSSTEERPSLVVGLPSSNIAGLTDDNDEHSRVSVVDSRADFDDVGSDSWDDDDDRSIDIGSKKKMPEGIAKFMNRMDETDRSQRSGDNELDNCLEPSSPPVKPKRTTSTGSSEVEFDTCPTYALRKVTNRNVKRDGRTSFETDEMTSKRSKDFMTELGLSDISELSSSGRKSASNKDHVESDDETDLDGNFADDNVEFQINKTNDSVELQNNHSNHNDSETDVVLAGENEGPRHSLKRMNSGVGFSSNAKDVKSVNESGGESDWDVSDGSLNGTIYIQPVGLHVSLPMKTDFDGVTMKVDLAVANRNSSANEVQSEVRPNVGRVPIITSDANGRINKDEQIIMGNEKKGDTMSSDGTLGRFETMHEVEEVWEQNPCLAMPSVATCNHNERDEGIYHAELACVKLREDVMSAEQDLQNADMVWNRLWLYIFGSKRITGGNVSDSIDEPSSILAALTDNENCRSDQLAISELSFPDDTSCNSTSVQEDASFELLATYIRNPANANRVLAIVQYLRRAWNFELLNSNRLTENMNILESQVKIARTRAESSNSAQANLSSTVLKLKTELQAVEQSLAAERSRSQETSSLLTKKEQQLDSLEQRYMDEVSKQQKTGLKLRTLQLEAENAQQLILQLKNEQLDPNPRSVSIVAVQTDFVIEDWEEVGDAKTLEQELSNELIRNKEQLDSIRLSLLNEEARRRSAEQEATTLRNRVSNFESQLAQMEELPVTLRHKIESNASEKTTDQNVADFDAALCSSEENLRIAEKELLICRRQIDETSLEFDLLKNESEARQIVLDQSKETAKQQKDEVERLVAELFETQKKLLAAQLDNSALRLQFDSNERQDLVRKEMETCLQTRWEGIFETFRRDFQMTEKMMIEKNLALSQTVSSLQEELRQSNERMLELHRELSEGRLFKSQLTAKVDSLVDDMEMRRREVLASHRKCKDFQTRNEQLNGQLKEAVKCGEAKSKDTEFLNDKLKKFEERLLTAEGRAATAQQELERRRATAATKRQCRQESLFDASVDPATAVSNAERQQVDIHQKQSELKAGISALSGNEEQLKFHGSTNILNDWSSTCRVEATGTLENDDLLPNRTTQPKSGNMSYAHDKHDKSFVGKETFIQEGFVNSIKKDLQILQSGMDSMLESHRPIEDFEVLYCKAEMLWRSLKEEKLKRQKLHKARMVNVAEEILERDSFFQSAPSHHHRGNEFNHLHGNHHNCVERKELELLARKLEVQSTLEINRRLQQINAFLEEQAKLSRHQMLLHNQHESNLLHDSSTTIEELRNKVHHLQRQLEDKDARHVALEEQYHDLCHLIEAKRRVRVKLTSDANPSLRRHSRGYSLHRCPKRGVYSGYTSSIVSSVNPVELTTSLRMFSQFDTKNLRTEKEAADCGLSYKLREELERTVCRHLSYDGPRVHHTLSAIAD